MFTALARIARDTPLTLTITTEADRLHVIIAGKGDKPRAFAAPVKVTGTPEELDAELPAQLDAYAAQLQAPATAIALPAPERTTTPKPAARPPAARKVAAKKPAAPKKATGSTEARRKAARSSVSNAAVGSPTGQPDRARPRARAAGGSPAPHFPGKPECLADLRALQAKHGAKLTRRKFIKEAATGRRYEKLWKNFEAFVAEAAQGERPLEPAAPLPVTSATCTISQTGVSPTTPSLTAIAASAPWPFPVVAKTDTELAVYEAYPQDLAAIDAEPAAQPPEPKPRVVGPVAEARPVTTTEEVTDGTAGDGA